MRRAIVLVLVLLVPLAVRSDSPGRTLAITIDDLPYASVEGVSDAGALADVQRINEAILAALARHRAPAVGFVNESRLQVAGERDARVAVLQRWVEAGLVLGNHTFSHLKLQDTPLEQYEDDVVRGDVVTRRLMQGKPLFFRYPFNSTGPSKEIKEAFLAFLAARGYRIAPFTVEHADYAFDKHWVRARRSGDGELERRTAAAYLDHLDTQLAFFEKLSQETFGREIPQVLLIHANEINAAHLDAMLSRMEARGYRFVWSVSLGTPMRLRDEPDPPKWVLE